MRCVSPGGLRVMRLLFAAGLIAGGLALAWPFRHMRPAKLGGSDRPAVVDVPLRAPDIAVQAGPAGEMSPAAPLADDDAGHVAAATYRALRPDLASLGPPPVLPQDFGPAGPDERAAVVRDWQPARLKLPSRAPTLRRHRLTDGDSLERLAERYLGSAARAGEIYAVNRDLLTAPDLLPLGRIIRIPPKETEEPLQSTGFEY